MCYINRWVQTELWLIDLIQQSHNAPVPCPTMHHSGTEMCTCAHISVTLVVKCLYNTIIVLQPTHRHCIGSSRFSYCHITCNIASHQTVPQIAKFMGPTWSPPRSCRPQMGSMLAPWTLLSACVIRKFHCILISTSLNYNLVLLCVDYIYKGK